MTCHYRNNDSDTLLMCMGLSPIFAAEDVQNFASRTGAGSGDVYNFVVSCLRVNRQIRPNIPEGPCGNTHNVISPGQQIGKTISSKVTHLANIDPEPISHFILLGAGILGNLFSNLFSGAPSQRELQTDCAVVSTYNSFADQYESALAQGQVALQDALVALKSVNNQVDSALSSLEGYNKTDWAPYFHRKANDALYVFNKEVIFPNIFEQSSGGKNAVLLAGGGILAAKLLGVL